MKTKKATGIWWCVYCRRPLRGKVCPDCRVSRAESDRLTAEAGEKVRREVVDAEKLAKGAV